MEGIETIERVSTNEPRHRRRTGKKRLRFGVPQSMPPGVRELWQSAGMDEQTRAHRACVQILAMWLGKRRREEVAAELSIPPLRVWQLSQLALSGMLAGLLKQPRLRRRKEGTMPQPLREDDPRVLRKKIAELEKQVTDQQDLIQLMAQLPQPRSKPPESNATPAAKTRRRRRTKSREEGGGSTPGDAPPAQG